MNPDEDLEQQLRASFRDLRRADGRLAPPIDRAWPAALAAHGRPPRPVAFRVRPAAAAVTAVAAIGVAVAVLNSGPGGDARVAGGRSTPPPPPAAAPHAPGSRDAEATISIDDWESPTAGLLELAAEDPPPSGRESF